MGGDPQNFHHQAMQHNAEDLDQEEDDGELPGWGHWAMPAEEDDLID